MNFQTLHRTARPDVHRGRAGGGLGRLHQQDSYLSTHRGEYAERNGVLLPMVWRLDFSVAQDLFKNIGGTAPRARSSAPTS